MSRRRDIYKVLRGHELAVFVSSGSFAGSPDDVRDGFIHLSTAAQVGGTLAKHFASETGLYAVLCSQETTRGALQWERSRNGEPFPHLYRELLRQDVVMIVPVPDERPQDWNPSDLNPAP